MLPHAGIAATVVAFLVQASAALSKPCDIIVEGHGANPYNLLMEKTNIVQHKFPVWLNKTAEFAGSYGLNHHSGSELRLDRNSWPKRVIPSDSTVSNRFGGIKAQSYNIKTQCFADKTDVETGTYQFDKTTSKLFVVSGHEAQCRPPARSRNEYSRVGLSTVSGYDSEVKLMDTNWLTECIREGTKKGIGQYLAFAIKSGQCYGYTGRPTLKPASAGGLVACALPLPPTTTTTTTITTTTTTTITTTTTAVITTTKLGTAPGTGGPGGDGQGGKGPIIGPGVGPGGDGKGGKGTGPGGPSPTTGPVTDGNGKAKCCLLKKCSKLHKNA